MPSLQEVLADPNYVNANPATKRAIFEKYAGQDPNYAQANAATKNAIRQKFGVGEPVEEAPPAAPVKPPERTYGEAAQDVAAKLISGTGSLVQLPGQLYGLATGDFSKTGLLGAGEDIRKYGESLVSPSLKAKEEARAQKIAESEKTGELAAAGTAFGETIKDPALLIGFLVEQVPQLIPALLTGGGTAALTASGIAAKEAAALVASGAAKEAAEIAAKQIAAKKAGELGVQAAVGTGAVQQGADVGAGAYENIYKAAIAKGVPEAEAASIALNAARAAGASGAIISLLAQRLPGARTLEESFAGVPGTTGRILGAGKGALGESAGEVVEEGGGKFSQNLAMREVDPEQRLTEGLGQATGMAAIGGGGMGLVAGAARRPGQEEVKPEEPPPPDVETLPPAPEAPPETPTAVKPPPEPPKTEFKPADVAALANYTEGLPDDAADVFKRLQNRDRATPASIQQMQGLASNPDYDRLKTSPDFGSGAPVVISDVQIPENQMGRQDIVTASDGRKIPVQYAIVDAGSLLTSHTASGQTNPEYGNVTTPAIRAVAGNGRIAGLQAAYNNKTAEGYVAGLQGDNQHGVDPTAIESIQNPVLVRIMPKSYVTPDIGDVSNVAGQLRLNPVEAAKNDVNRFDLQGLQYNEDGGVNANSVIQFIRAMPKEEQGELIDKNGAPNAIAFDRLNNAIFYKAYGSDSLIDLYAQAADPEAKLILQGLAKAAPNVSQLEGAGEYDIRPNIIEAAELAVNARRQGVKLKDFVNQGQLGIDSNTMAVLEMFAEHGRSGKRMGELLGKLADKASEQAQAGEDMFGEKPKLPLADVFKALKAEGEPDLFTEPTEPKELPEPKDFVAKKSMEEIAKEIKGMTATQLAQWAVDNAPNSAAKAIAEKVLIRIKELDERGFFNKPVEVLNRSDLRYRGRFTYALNFSFGNLKFAGLKNGKAHAGTGTRYITILHELLHAATVPALATKGKEYNDLNVVLNKVKKQISADQKAGKTHPIFSKIAGGANTIQNIKELISWGLTDPEFQDYLSTVKVGETNALTRMVQIFRKLLGLDAKYETALDAVVRATDTILDTPTELIEKGLGRSIGTKKVAPKPAAPPAAKPAAKNAPPTLTAPKGFKIPAGRNEQVVLAARELKAGNITKQQYDEYVDYYMPVETILGDKLEKPLTETALGVVLSLPKVKKDAAKINANIADGTKVGLRMDIPALVEARKVGMNGSVVSIHEGKPATNAAPGKNISYKSAGALKNAVFAIRSEEKAFNIAQALEGKVGQKSPQQTIEGTWVNMTPEEIFKLVQEKLNDPEWSQVSLDPLRHSFFYDRSNTKPVVSADEVLQVGRFVLAKNVKYGKREEFLYEDVGKEKYVTQDEIFDMQRKAYEEFRNTEEFKKSQKRIEDAQKESNDRYQAVAKEAVRLLREQPQFKDVLDDLPESSIYNIAMTAFREVAEKNIPMPKISEHDAIVAHNKLIEDFFKSKKIPEPRAFSEQANQERPYYSDPRFKNWFGNSKVVNKNGKPLVAFHTTDKNFNVFSVGNNVSGKSINPNYTGKLGSWFTAPSLYEGNYEVGNAENAVSFTEGKEGDNTMLVHLSIQNPMEYEGFEDLQDDRNSYSSVEKFKKSLTEKGYDGVVVRNSMTDGDVDRDDWVAFFPTQIKSAIGNNGNFSLEKEAIEEENIGDKLKAKAAAALQPRKPLAPESFQGVSPDFIDKANPIFAPQKKTIIDRLEGMRDRFWQRLAQGIADQFRTIKEYSEDAYMLARMSKTVDGALEGLMFFGQVFNDGGALNIKSGTKGLIEVLKPLGNEVDRYQMWIALSRESELPPNKRSQIDNLDELVERRDELIAGDIDGKPREQVYKAVRTEMNKLNRSVLKVALDAGLIDSTANAIDRLNARIQDTLNNDKMSDAKKEDEIADLEAQIEELRKNPIGYERFAADINYIPFYREMEDGDVSKVMTASGLSNQQFSKALEGGVSPFADLMENTLRNWSHILSASMKNQAAAATLTAAQNLGGAEANLKVPYYMIDGKVYYRSNDEMVGDGSVKSWMTTAGKGTVKAMVEGQPVHYNVLDPLLLDSIASIGYMGPKSKFLDVARGFKNVLQFGVTISPAFKVNNLIRDSVQAMAVSDLKKNPFANVVRGWILSDQNNPAHMSALAGGALFNFGSIVEGDQAALIKRLVKMGVKEEHILDTPAKIKNQLKKAWDKYQEFGNKSEAANRMALYQQLKDKGYGHLEASFYARDLLDFSMQGSWPAFRLLTQVIPFLNARVQGLYKLGRDGINPTVRVFYNSITGKPIEQTDKQKAESFGIVTMAVCLASLALYFAFKDDEEYKKRDDWDRDNFWWFKLPGMDYALRIPKPFEIGAFGTLSERVAEQIFDQGAEGKQFEKSLKNMITNTFAVNLPQFVKPLVDLYANKDSFTGAPIESAGMERLSKQERATDSTSPLAIALGGLSSVALPGEGLSPVQVDYAIKAYFGWLGGTIAQTSHYAVMPFKSGAYPDTKWIDKVSVGLIKSLPANQSKYATAFYESNKEISQAYADMRHYAEIGDSEKVLKILEEKRDKIQLNKFYDKTAKNMSKVRLQIRVIMNDDTMSGAAKREEIDRLKEIISMLAKQAEDTRKSLKTAAKE